MIEPAFEPPAALQGPPSRINQIPDSAQDKAGRFLGPRPPGAFAEQPGGHPVLTRLPQAALQGPPPESTKLQIRSANVPGGRGPQKRPALSCAEAGIWSDTPSPTPDTRQRQIRFQERRIRRRMQLRMRDRGGYAFRNGGYAFRSGGYATTAVLHLTAPDQTRPGQTRDDLGMKTTSYTMNTLSRALPRCNWSSNTSTDTCFCTTLFHFTPPCALALFNPQSRTVCVKELSLCCDPSEALTPMNYTQEAGMQAERRAHILGRLLQTTRRHPQSDAAWLSAGLGVKSWASNWGRNPRALHMKSAAAQELKVRLLLEAAGAQTALQGTTIPGKTGLTDVAHNTRVADSETSLLSACSVTKTWYAGSSQDAYFLHVQENAEKIEDTFLVGFLATAQ